MKIIRFIAAICTTFAVISSAFRGDWLVTGWAFVVLISMNLVEILERRLEVKDELIDMLDKHISILNDKWLNRK